jgi:hypothetical protein
VPFVRGPLGPLDPIVYYLDGASRRLVPDAQTLAFMFPGGTVRTATAQELALPLGARLPTRVDGTVYLAPGAYAYVMSAGLRRAVPDATTLRDLGHTIDGAVTLAAADVALMPIGASNPSTSKFATPPASQIPLVLLPVRLETRFASGELWVRMFPDTVHVDSFEPALTAAEASARASYLALPSSDAVSRKTTFAALARQFGASRAAYITGPDASAASKADDWTIAPFTNVLPERWIVLGYNGTAPGQVLAVGNPIADSLAVGPAPNSAGPTTDEGIQWLSNFDRAVAAGMGVRIPLTGTTAGGFDRLVVIGLRSTLAPGDSSARVAALLQAHHYSDGLALLPRDAATNNTETTPSAFSTADPDFDALFAVEQGAALCPVRPTGDGDRLASALAIPGSTFAHVAGADGGLDEQAHAINAVLWPATWGYYLEQLVTGAVPDPSTTIPAARDHFIAHVRARGHFPTLMAGRQPYGILPVCWSANWKPLGTDALGTQLSGLLAKARATWESSVANVPRIPGSSDAEAALVSVLGMTPSSNTFAARGMIGPEYTFTYFNFAKKDLDATWWSALAKKTSSDAAAVGGTLAATRLAGASYVRQPRDLGTELVAPEPLAGQSAPSYVAQMATLGWQALRDLAPPASPAPLLFSLLRQAALRAYLDAGLDLLTAANAAQPAERIEAELVGFGMARPTAWDLLNRALPGRGPVGSVLDGAKSSPTVPAFAAFWTAFGALASFSAADLDAVTREVFDLASYRLDAWITSLAQARLDALRAANPAAGTVIGGYGWLEGVHPQTAMTPSSGFIHAPSIAQAASAAILRAGFLAHSGEAGQPFSIDLSSKRVRLGLHLLDGMRAGQSLGALLGYRFERTLHDAQLDRFIDAFRLVAPMDAANALDVVDGLALVRAFGSDPAFWNAAGLPAAGTPERTGVTAALQTALDALDAVADLALSESVHQLTRGNTLRAGATLDAIARGDAPPLDIDFVKTPRSGSASTYRVMTFALDTAAGSWTATPRAQAEPRLNAWAGALLGDPSRVRIRVLFANAATPVPAEFGFDRLALAPLDVLSFPESQGAGGELADRIRAAASANAPAGVAAGATVEIVTDRDPAWPAQTIGLSEWLVLVKAVARLASGARAIEPTDVAASNATVTDVDAAELQARADAAEAQLRAAVTALQQTPVQAAALTGAAAFGASGLEDLSARAAALDALATGFDRSAATAGAQADHDTARLQAVFGPSFVVLPAFTQAASAVWPQLWAASGTLQGGDTLASVRFLQRASRVRAGAGRLDAALMLAESLAGRPFPPPDVAQFPVVANDRWSGLETTSPTTSALSLIGFTPGAQPAGARIAGLMIDEWIDIVPSSDQTTGVACDYPDPALRPPQAILLAVAPDAFPEWTLEAVEGSVLEALDLAKIRGVDPDALGALGHYLPAIVVPYNTGAGVPDVPSIDVTAIRVVAESNR